MTVEAGAPARARKVRLYVDLREPRWNNLSGSTPSQRSAHLHHLLWLGNLTGAWPTFRGEVPDPAPSVGLSYPLGTPIYIEGAGTLAGLSVVLTTAAGQAVSTSVLTAANDQNHYLQPTQAYVLPSQPLAPNTTYNVTISGTSGITPFVQAFSFSTGAQN